MQLASNGYGTTAKEKGPQVVIIETEIGIEVVKIDAAMAMSIEIDLVTDDGVLHQPSHANARAENIKMPATMRRLNNQNVLSQKKKKKKKKSKDRSDDDEANDDEPQPLSPTHRTKRKEPEASDADEGDLNDTDSIFDADDELVREPAKGKVVSTSKDRASTPPPPDLKKVLAKDYEPGLSGKYKGKKTNLDEDGDEADNEAIVVKADTATPDKSKKTALEEKKAKLEKMLEETEQLLSNEDLKVVLKSKDSEEDKLNQAYLLGKQAADQQRSKTPPQSRDSRDLIQIPRSDDVPLGIPPEEWESLEVQRKIAIRKIAQDRERSQYFDWGNALFSAKKAEVQKTLDCLANEPAHKLSGLFNKPEKAGLKMSAKEADSSAALSISIVKQAQQAGQSPRRAGH